MGLWRALGGGGWEVWLVVLWLLDGRWGWGSSSGGVGVRGSWVFLGVFWGGLMMGVAGLLFSVRWRGGVVS